MSATDSAGLLAALEAAGAAGDTTTAPSPPEPAQAPTTPPSESPTPPTPQTPPATTETPPAAPPPKTPDEIRAEIEAEYRRKEAGWQGQTKKWENAAKRAEEALAAREKAIDDDLARLRDAAPDQRGKEYYQAALDQRAIARQSDDLKAREERIAQAEQAFVTAQQQTEERILRTEADSILPGYLKEQLAARGLPSEAGAELQAILDLPANKKFLQNAPLAGAFTWIAEMGQYIDQQLPALQTKWAQGNRAEARTSGEHWRPTGGNGGTPQSAAPKTMAETSGASLADFIANYEG